MVTYTSPGHPVQWDQILNKMYFCKIQYLPFVRNILQRQSKVYVVKLTSVQCNWTEMVIGTNR